jgi:O-methyltransferase
MKTIITPELWQYSLDFGNKELPEILLFINNFNKGLPNGHMQTGVEQCCFMGFLAKAIQANSYLEVGIFTGYSLISMSTQLPFNAILTALELEEKNIETVKYHVKIANEISLKSPLQPKIYQDIEYIQGDANITMPELVSENRKYDLIFIDANKSSSIDYYQYAKKLLSKSGVLMIDNVFKGYNNLADNNKAPKFIEKVHNMNLTILHDQEVEFCMLPIADGLTLIRLKQ